MARAATARKQEPSPKGTGAIKMISPKIEQGNNKAALEAAGATKATYHNVPVGEVKLIPGFNVRMADTTDYAEEVENIKNSIVKGGFDPAHPLSVFVGKDGDADVIYVVDGHKRYNAVQRANAEGAEITTVPVVVKPKGFTMRDANVAMHRENLHSKLTMAEKAVIVNRLLKMDMSEEEIANELGLTERMVQDYLLLINSSKVIRNLVKTGVVSGTEAVRLLRKHAKTPGKAEEVMQGMAKKAEAVGDKKATRKHSEEGTARGRTVAEPEEEETPVRTDGKPRRLVARMEEISIKWAVSKDQEFPLSDIKRFKQLFSDTDWYSLISDKEGYAVATEDVQFKATIIRPKKEAKAEVEEAIDDVAEDDVDEEIEEDETDDVDDEIEEDDEHEEALAASGRDDL